MVGRSLRVLCLAIAAWALLFAPGAAGADTTDSTNTGRAERVAAAVLAPTFESHAVGITSRAPTRSVDDGTASCEPAVGHVRVHELHVPCDTPVEGSTRHHGSSEAPGTTSSASRRGPPRT